MRKAIEVVLSVACSNIVYYNDVTVVGRRCSFRNDFGSRQKRVKNPLALAYVILRFLRSTDVHESDYRTNCGFLISGIIIGVYILMT